MEQQILERYLQIYETIIGEISRRYYWPNRNTGAFDLEDLEQAGRTAIFNISRKRPEKLDTRNYVCAAIKYSIFNEMKKMRHREKHVYLVTEDETIPLVDVFPTKEKGNKFDESEDLLYHIKNEFSKEDAEGLERLLEKCENIYGLNLNEPTSTDTKERVKVVTLLDLNDDEMRTYAEVLLGVRQKFPDGFSRGEDGKRKAKKYARKLLYALGISPKEFLRRSDKAELIDKYRLRAFYKNSYRYSVLDFMREFDSSLSDDDVMRAGKPLKRREREEVLKAFERYEGVLSKAAKALGHSIHTIARYWRANGFPIRDQSDRSLTPRQVQEVVDSYQKCNGSAGEAARDLGFDVVTIINYWRDKGFKIKERGWPTLLSPKEQENVLQAHKLYMGNVTEASRHLEHDRHTISKYWKDAGLEVNTTGRPRLSEDEVSEIVSSFGKFEGKPFRAAKALGYDVGTIKKYWSQAGLTKKGKRRYWLIRS